MNLADAIPDDELVLARLTTTKLAKVMHGLMSVGTGSLGLEPPMAFLAGREKTPLGFLEVLRCMGVKPGHAEKIPLLRQQVQQLAQLTSRFHALFLDLAQWRDMSGPNLQEAIDRLGDCYSEFCERLGEFGSLLGMQVDYTLQAQQDRHFLAAFFETHARQGHVSA